MPAPGDQHKSNGAATANPFVEEKPHINIYTAQEIATLQDRLNKRLGPEYISTRAGPGNKKVAYLSAEKAINLANEIFGFNGWSSSIQNIQIDFVDENSQTGKISIGLSVVVRVTLRDGTFHEDIGYGGIENCKGKIAAFEKAKKEGTTDALKRALRNFGNVLGNCIYDHDYIAKVSKIKAGPGKWDVNNLHRHQDFATKVDEQTKQPNAVSTSVLATKLEVDESFDVAEFDDNDFEDFGNPDEMLLPANLNNRNVDGKVSSATSHTPSKAPILQVNQTENTATPNQNSISQQTNTNAGHIGQLAVPNAVRGPQRHNSATESHAPSRVVSQHFGPPQPLSSAQQVGGFYSARAAEHLDQNNIPTGPEVAKFNPYAESPSIRKTSGVDHSKSIALNKHTLKPEVLPPKDLVDHKADTSRRLGMPGQGVSSPGPRSAGTSAYRPPTRHGPQTSTSSNVSTGGVDRVLNSTRRPPLEDVSNLQHSTTSVNMDGGDAKRQKLTQTSPSDNHAGVEMIGENAEAVT